MSCESWPPLNSQCQPRKENHSQVTGRQIAQAEGAAGEVLLGKFFQPDQEGEDQVTGHRNPSAALSRNGAKGGQVNQQGQNAIKGEMADFVPQRNPVDKLEDTKIPGIRQGNDEDDKQPKENSEPFHKKIETP